MTFLAMYIYFDVVGIALILGDSLPIHLDPLLYKNIRSRGKYIRNIDVYGYNGNPIAAIKEKYYNNFDAYVRNGYYRGVILFYDSDVSNYDETTMTPTQVTSLRQSYEENLVAIIHSIKPYAKLAVASPALLSDGNYTRMIANFGANKTQMLNDYASINQRICADTGIEYIDIRGAYLDSLHRGYDPAEVEDGEHPNALGQDIAGRLFASVLDTWWKLDALGF
jgi:hypothetical protein